MNRIGALTMVSDSSSRRQIFVSGDAVVVDQALPSAAYVELLAREWQSLGLAGTGLCFRHTTHSGEKMLSRPMKRMSRPSGVQAG